MHTIKHCCRRSQLLAEGQALRDLQGLLAYEVLKVCLEHLVSQVRQAKQGLLAHRVLHHQHRRQHRPQRSHHHNHHHHLHPLHVIQNHLLIRLQNHQGDWQHVGRI